MKLYNNPTKSSCDGGIKNLNLPLLDPRFLALVAANLFSDSMFISFSLWDYLLKYEIPYINFPFTLLSQFIGLIPATIIFLLS